MYQIQRTTPLAGPNVSSVLNDNDYQVIFIPNTNFEVTKMEYYSVGSASFPGSKAIIINMKTSDINTSLWNDHLVSCGTWSLPTLIRNRLSGLP